MTAALVLADDAHSVAITLDWFLRDHADEIAVDPAGADWVKRIRATSAEFQSLADTSVEVGA